MPGLEDTTHLLQHLHSGLGWMDQFLITQTGPMVNPMKYALGLGASTCAADHNYSLEGGMIWLLLLGLLVMFVHTTSNLHSFELSLPIYHKYKIQTGWLVIFGSLNFVFVMCVRHCDEQKYRKTTFCERKVLSPTFAIGLIKFDVRCDVYNLISPLSRHSIH